MKGLIHNGQLVEADVEVVDGREHDLWFDKFDPNTYPRGGDADLVVLHHQAGEGDARRLHRVLKKRRLSVHFEIDREGVITQLADLSTVCAHAGDFNERSVGIEMANMGAATMSRRMLNLFRRRYSRRQLYEDEAHGRKINFFRFFPMQVGAAYDLCRALCEVLEIPYRFPYDDVDKRVIRTTIADGGPAPGLCGHMHLVKTKIGPSPHLMDDLAAQASVT